MGANLRYLSFGKILAIFGRMAAILDPPDIDLGGKDCPNQKMYFAKVV